MAAASLYERYKDALRRGHVAALRGRDDAAIDAYGEAASIAPDRALPHVSLGGILLRTNRLPEAAAAYTRATDLAPRDESAIRGLADVHLRAGRRTTAAAALDRLADILDADGRLADATDAARRALELAESRARRNQVEAFASRLRESSGADEAARRALDQVLRVLEPASAQEDAGATPDAADPEPGTDGSEDSAGEPAIEPSAGGAAPSGESGTDQTIVEPAGLGIALGAAAEAALHGGDVASAREGLLAAARSHRRAGRTGAAIDACYLAIGLIPVDADLHLLLAELYLDRGWRSLAADKLLLLGHLAELREDAAGRERLCALVGERLADEPRLVALCA